MVTVQHMITSTDTGRRQNRRCLRVCFRRGPRTLHLIIYCIFSKPFFKVCTQTIDLSLTALPSVTEESHSPQSTMRNGPCGIGFRRTFKAGHNKIERTTKKIFQYRHQHLIIGITISSCSSSS